MNWRLVTGVLGAAATLFGVGSLFVPAVGRLLQTDPTRLAAADPVVVVGTAAVLAGGIGLALGGRSVSADGEGTETPGSEQFATPTARAVSTAGEGIAGNRLDTEVRTAVQSGDEPLTAVRDRLRTAAVAAHAEATGVTVERAARAVDGGEWTDDTLAAAFLADGLSPSGRARLRSVLAPAQERRRRIERTIAAVERLQADP